MTSQNGERRAVTIVFADISDFTGLGERLDPEQVAELVRECFQEVIDEVRGQEGWVGKQMGDAVLAVFGAPLAHEDDPLRAVRAALAIRRRVRHLNEQVQARIGGPLDVHVGINTGLAVIAPAAGYDTADGDEYMVIGDTVTTAARLQQTAGPGQIIVGESTYSATKWQFEYQPLEPLRLKGKQGRVAAWACLGERSAHRARREADSPLVGRVRERAAVEGCLQLLLSGRGNLLLLSGDAGVGKTRLLAEARARAGEQRLLWLEGGTISFGEPIAYAPFIDALRQLAGIVGDDDAQAWPKLERLVRQLFGADEWDEILPYLGALLALKLPQELVVSLRHVEGEGVGLQIFRTTRLLFERLAQREPVALVFEDWHWADESSAMLLEHLLPLVRTLPILFCCSARPEPAPLSALREHAVASGLSGQLVDVEVAPLGRDETGELVTRLTREQALPRPLYDQIVAATEGNPFFIEEIVNSLAGGGLPPASLEIPATLRGTLTARVDRLPEAARRVLRTASVLGRTFHSGLLRELAPGEDVDHALTALTEADLLRDVSGPDGPPTYSFKHAITQNVVYNNVLLAHRRALHAAVAQRLEVDFPDRLDELAGTLAFHHAQAEHWEEAQRFLLRAGDQAGNIAASSEALAYYTRALEAYSRAAGPEWATAQRAELDRKIGEAFFRRGDHDQAAYYLEQALARLGFDYPATPTGVRLAIARAAFRQLAHRLLPGHRRLSEENDPWMDELSRTFDTLGWIYFFSNPERVVLDSFRQLNTAERRGHRLAIVRASTGLGFTFDAIPVRALAGRYHRRAVAHSATLQNRRSVGIAHLGLAHHQRFQLADFDAALTNYTRAAEECRHAGDLRSRMGATLMLAEVTALTGNLAASLEHGRQLLEIGEDAGDNQVCGWGHHAAGRTLRLAGRWADAEAHLERGCRLSAAVPDYQALIVARGNLGLTLLEQDRLDEALALLGATHTLMQERRLRTFARTDLLKALTAAYAAAVERAEHEERDLYLKRAYNACQTLARQERLDRAAAPAALRLRGTLQWLRGKHGRATALWRDSSNRATALRLPHELALTQLEAGHRTGDLAITSAASRQLSELAGNLTSHERVEAPTAV